MTNGSGEWRMANKQKKEPTHANIFVPLELKDQIDANADVLGLKSRTEAIRIGQKLLASWINQTLIREPVLFENMRRTFGDAITANELLGEGDE